MALVFNCRWVSIFLITSGTSRILLTTGSSVSMQLVVRASGAALLKPLVIIGFLPKQSKRGDDVENCAKQVDGDCYRPCRKGGIFGKAAILNSGRYCRLRHLCRTDRGRAPLRCDTIRSCRCVAKRGLRNRLETSGWTALWLRH